MEGKEFKKPVERLIALFYREPESMLIEKRDSGKEGEKRRLSGREDGGVILSAIGKRGVIISFIISTEGNEIRFLHVE